MIWNKELLEKCRRYNLAKPTALVAKKDEDTYDVFVYDAIGNDVFGGISAKQFADEMKSVPDGAALNVRINSPGGDVFEGLAIYNLLSQRKGKKTVMIDGLAASIASVVAMAGDRVVMASESEMMIHEAWAMTAGNAEDLRKLAERLDASNQSIRSIYQRKTGQDEKKLVEMMAAETWMSAAQAQEMKFADEIIVAGCGGFPDKKKKMQVRMSAIELMRARSKR